MWAIAEPHFFVPSCSLIKRDLTKVLAARWCETFFLVVSTVASSRLSRSTVTSLSWESNCWIHQTTWGLCTTDGLTTSTLETMLDWKNTTTVSKSGHVQMWQWNVSCPLCNTQHTHTHTQVADQRNYSTPNLVGAWMTTNSAVTVKYILQKTLCLVT